LADYARMTTLPPTAGERRMTPPPPADSRTASPPRADDAGAGAAVGDVETSASPRIIDVDPISARPGGVDDDLLED
jgi:hypothetical protein